MADTVVRSDVNDSDKIPISGKGPVLDQAIKTKGNEGKRPSRLRAVIVFLCIAAVVGGGIYAYTKLFVEGFESTDDAKIQGNQAIISSQTLGQIRSLDVDLGDRVSKGQILATLEDRTQQAQKNQVFNLIEQAKVSMDQARISYENGSASVQLSQTKLQQAKGDLDRATSQAKAGVASQEQLEHAKAAYDAALASYDIAVGQRRLAEAGETAAETQLKGAQSQLEAVDANMAHVVMTATIGGVVARKWVMPGDVVQPAQAIYTLFDLGDLWIDANFKETQLRNLKVGDPVSISVDAYPGLKLPGKIERLGVTTAAQFALIPQDNTSGNYTKLTQRVPVRIALVSDRQDAGSAASSVRGEALLPGMSVEVTVRTKRE
jgi:membrane fusion protein (multidrug efflux system)